MQEVRIVIERAFDIQKWSTRSGFKYSTFSFESKGKRYFSLSISGWEGIPDGTEIVALLREPSNWQSLSGWVVVPSCAIRAQPMSGPLSAFIVPFSAAFLFWALTPRPANPADNKLWWLFEGAFILLTISRAFGLLQHQKTLKTLESISTRLATHTFRM